MSGVVHLVETFGPPVVSGGALTLLATIWRSNKVRHRRDDRRDDFLWGRDAGDGLPAQAGVAERLETVVDRLETQTGKMEGQSTQLDEISSYAHAARHEAKSAIAGQEHWNEAFNRRLDRVEDRVTELERTKS